MRPRASSPPRRHGFLRSSKGAFTTVDVPDAVLTVAEGINNPGTIVGLYQAKDGSFHGFVSNNGVVFTKVDVPGSSVTQIFSINGSTPHAASALPIILSSIG